MRNARLRVVPVECARPGAGGPVLRNVRRDDAVSICGLYNHYVVGDADHL